MDRYDTLVVGAGYAGSIMARELAEKRGQRVLVIDRRDHIAGNAYDYYDEAGVQVHKYGPHIFHTNSGKVVEYLSRFTEWRPYERQWMPVDHTSCSRLVVVVDDHHLPRLLEGLLLECV